MEAFAKFEHFVTIFVPGFAGSLFIIISTAVFFAKSDPILYMFSAAAKDDGALFIFILTIFGTITGLFIDIFRHTVLEWMITVRKVDRTFVERWSNYMENEHRSALRVKKSLGFNFDIYEKLLQQSYRQVFLFNIAVVMVFSVVAIPLYLHRFHPRLDLIGIFAASVIFILARIAVRLGLKYREDYVQIRKKMTAYYDQKPA